VLIGVLTQLYPTSVPREFQAEPHAIETRPNTGSSPSEA
jgi:hypothetical protein